MKRRKRIKKITFASSVIHLPCGIHRKSNFGIVKQSLYSREIHVHVHCTNTRSILFIYIYIYQKNLENFSVANEETFSLVLSWFSFPNNSVFEFEKSVTSFKLKYIQLSVVWSFSRWKTYWQYLRAKFDKNLTIIVQLSSPHIPSSSRFKTWKKIYFQWVYNIFLWIEINILTIDKIKEKYYTILYLRCHTCNKCDNVLAKKEKGLKRIKIRVHFAWTFGYVKAYCQKSTSRFLLKVEKGFMQI